MNLMKMSKCVISCGQAAQQLFFSRKVGGERQWMEKLEEVLKNGKYAWTLFLMKVCIRAYL